MIHVRENKIENDNFYEQRFHPKRVVLPLGQHIGAYPEIIVEKGEIVELGQCLAKAQSFVSANIHSPVNGIVKEIKKYNHPVRGKDISIIIEASDEAEFVARERNPKSFTHDELLAIVHDAGIVGMGGACFPTHVKLKSPKAIDTLIVNGCECEPYLGCDNRIMVDHTDHILEGIALVCRVLAVQKVIIAIEENKPEAIKRFNSKLHTKKYEMPKNVEVQVLPSVFPQGSEKQLIYNTTKRIVPAGGLPFEVGCVVQNVATLLAFYQAAYWQKPLIDKVVTFSGGALKEPKNVHVRIGTVVQDLFDAGILELKTKPKKIIFGGPMMGFAVRNVDYPIMKGTSGVLFLNEEECDDQEESSCIRCSRCIDVCPMNLMPQEFQKLVKANKSVETDEFYVNDCIECGCCTFACPAKIPIVGYIKTAKSELRQLKQKSN